MQRFTLLTICWIRGLSTSSILTAVSKDVSLITRSWATYTKLGLCSHFGFGSAQSPPRCTKCNRTRINAQCTNFIVFDVAPCPLKGFSMGSGDYDWPNIVDKQTFGLTAYYHCMNGRRAIVVVRSCRVGAPPTGRQPCHQRQRLGVDSRQAQ